MYIDENSFHYLAAHPTVQGWKQKLHLLIEGASDETLFRLGSIEQYIRVLLAESKNVNANYYFREALSQVIQEWTPISVEPADRLHNMLSIITAFTPSVGFTKVLNHLNSGNVKRGEEYMSTEYQQVDLYKRGLIALAQYYPSSPSYSHDDFGFLAYKQLLEKNLADERYSGYAAVRLLELNILNIKSKQIASLLISSEKVAFEVFRYLINLADDPEERILVEEKLGDILFIYAYSDNIDKFNDIAASLGTTFDPEGDYEIYFPTLTLVDGRVLNIYLDMKEVKKTALGYYIGYNKKRLIELLNNDLLDAGKISRYVSGYITQVISDDNAIKTLVKELEGFNARIVRARTYYILRIQNEKHQIDIPLNLADDILVDFMKLSLRLSGVKINFPTQSKGR